MHSFSWLSQSPESPLSEVLRRIQMVAPSMLPVLILGETGVGKEIVARTIHETSPRAKEAFVAVNCGALPPSLLESMLFGAMRGAYTSSHEESKGFIRAAHKGTLFLDEIGELPLEAQSRLLRVLQERKVTPLGGHQEITVDFRLVCATHRNLSDAVTTKKFREDLFFRIYAFPLRIIPLRERPADIVPIASHFWTQSNPLKPEFEKYTSYEDRAMMIRFPWPGNIRQLRNLIEKYSILSDFGVSLQSLLLEEPQSFSVSQPSLDCRPTRHWNSIDPQRISIALAENSYNHSSTARSLGISRGSLNYQIKKWNIRRSLVVE